jgi:hypothetical protein
MHTVAELLRHLEEERAAISEGTGCHQRLIAAALPASVVSD